ncbi:uncharacterized protein TEOVI_000858500 [Trypanosoma equiperdum]|uniref:Uncharacterized protein n=1 Tax=Trypanosoma equiperdum TaxID=5694 RepID=A0A1G4I774_TRYEQ|nr:hypothetical protein, conserved [Trypanosoma equiperdum]
MAALRSVRSKQQVNKFCSVGSALLGDAVCFSIKEWDNTLRTLEAARCDPLLLPPLASLPTSAVCEAVRHYHNVYMKASELIVLRPLHWRKWQEGLCEFMDHTNNNGTDGGNSSNGSNTTLHTGCCELEVLCGAFLSQQREQFVVAFWGTVDSCSLRLKLLVSRFPHEDEIISVSPVAGDGMDGNGADLEEVRIAAEESADDMGEGAILLRKRYFRELYSFQRLACESAHLFGFYASVGKAERLWLTDTLLLERHEEAAEVLIRRSFKRDFDVPSLELVSGELLEDYKSFEVNESKQRVLLKRAGDTLKGLWCILAHDKFVKHQSQSKLQQKGVEEEYECGVEEEERSCGTDATALKFPEELVRCISCKAVRSVTAFATAVQSIVECNPSSPPSANLERLEFLLSLLLRWFEAYTGERHRGDIPLFLDTDLWEFLLQRHTELLKWVMSAYCSGETDVDYNSAVEAVQFVCLSVLRCLDVYKAAVVSKRCEESVKDKLKCVAGNTVAEWLKHTAIGAFLRGIRRACSDLCASGTRFCLSIPLMLIVVRSSVVESRLLLLCHGISCAVDVRQLLLPMVDLGFKEMSQLDKNADGTLLTSWVGSMTSVLNSLRRTLRVHGAEHAPADDFVCELHRHYLSLQRLSPAAVSDIVTDAWTDFLSSGFVVEGGLRGSRRVSLFSVSSERRSALHGAQQMVNGTHVDVGHEERDYKRPRKE